MRFTSSDNEVAEAIKVLEKLINTNTSNTIEAIRRHKTSNDVDMFTYYRMKKELAKVNEKL